jgi:hypothetical protein
MRVHVSDPSVITDLVISLLKGDCVPELVAECTVDVIHPYAVDDKEARVEISFFLRAWKSKHYGIDVALVA